jgi:hypothetical protein
MSDTVTWNGSTLYWGELVDYAPPGEGVVATAYVSGGGTSEPVFTCSDPLSMTSSDRVVINDPSALFVNTVVGYMGVKIGAPMANVRVASVSAALAVNLPALPATVWPMQNAGLAGSSSICVSRDYLSSSDYTFSDSVEFSGIAGNRARLSSLAMLIGWAGGSSKHCTFAYSNSTQLVIGVAFDFPLTCTATTWTADPSILSDAALTSDELSTAAAALANVSPMDVVECLGVCHAPRDYWMVKRSTIVTLASHLWDARNALIAQYS